MNHKKLFPRFIFFIWSRWYWWCFLHFCLESGPGRGGEVGEGMVRQNQVNSLKSLLLNIWASSFGQTMKQRGGWRGNWGSQTFSRNVGHGPPGWKGSQFPAYERPRNSRPVSWCLLRRVNQLSSVPCKDKSRAQNQTVNVTQPTTTMFGYQTLQSRADPRKHVSGTEQKATSFCNKVLLLHCLPLPSTHNFFLT